MRRLLNWILMLYVSALLAINSGGQTPAPPALLTLPPTLEQNLSAVAVLYNVGQDGKATPFGYGFFVNPWTIVTSNRLLQDANRDGALRLTVYSADGKQNYNALSVEVADKDRDMFILEVRERGPQGLTTAEVDKLKAGDKVYVLRAKTGAESAYVLVEAKAPLSKEHYGAPLFNEAGQLVGMGIDPSLKAFTEQGMLPSKALQKFSSAYMSPYNKGKMTCPPDFFCELDPSGKSDAAKSLKRARPYTGAFDDDSFSPPPKSDLKLAGDVESKSIRRIVPRYPDTAKSSRVSGSVVVRVVYDEQGEIILARAVSGHPLLQPLSIRAARQWLFEPTVVNGQKIKVEGFLFFNFTFQ